jgi:hypothetical protein
MRARIKELREQVEQRVRAKVRAALDVGAQEPKGTELQPLGSRSQDLAEAADEPPVVARLMVEIRSDGSRTVARGALQDELSGEQVSLVARGNSPLELALQLTRALVKAPLGAGQLARTLLQARAKATAEPGIKDVPERQEPK